jgi:quercetin dioxygenase-like cupin family protein
MSTNTFEKSTIYALNEAVDYASGSIVSKNVGNITLFSFDEGQNLSEHTAPFDAIVQVVEGQAKIIINKKGFILSTGDIIIMPANIPHAVEALGKFKMLLTMLKA